MNDIEKYNVKIYEFPVCDSDDDESFKKLDEDIKVIRVVNSIHRTFQTVIFFILKV